MRIQNREGDGVMDTKIVILNAPPNAGKDLGAAHLVEFFEAQGIPAKHMEFKESLFKLTKSAYGVDDQVWEQLYTRENKELPSYYLVLNGHCVSPREALINTSEKVIKPMFGKQAFGIMAANQLREGAVNVFSDGGFNDEVSPLIDRVGRENILVIKMWRPNCSFAGDSRDYLDEFELPVKFHRLGNDGTKEELFHKLESIVKGFVE